MAKNNNNNNTKEDVVNKPKHYNREGALQCIDEMILLFGVDVVKNFCLCNAWKYRYRAADKNGTEDLAKSDWYIKKYRELSGSDVTIEPVSPPVKEIQYTSHPQKLTYPLETPWTIGDWPPGPYVACNASPTPCGNCGQK